MTYAEITLILIALAVFVAGVAYVFSHQEAVFHDNVLINTHTLHAAKRNGIPHYIYVGTACSFPKGLQDGPGIHALKEDQTYPAEPESAYGWSKLMGEYEAELAMEPGVFNVGLLRFHNVYGPYSDYSLKSSQAIPSLIRKALLYPSEPYIVWGSGSQYRDFVFVDDIVEALLLVKDNGMNKGVIQLGSKHATTIIDLAKGIGDIIGKSTGQEIPIKFDTCQPEGDRGRIAAGERAEQILGWKPRVPLRRGLELTVDWMKLRGNQTTTLVIVTGQPDGRNDWRHLLKHLARSCNTHLAILYTDAFPQTMLQQHAQYNWKVPEICKDMYF
jgi:GDP-D-mannose 3',5'-epimerase